MGLSVKIFNDQHEMFRQTVRSFVEKEVAPHIEEWEEAGQIPKSIWPRMGQLGFLGVEYDEKYGGGGADFLTTVVLCEEMARSRLASLAMAVGVHTDMASPHLYWAGSEALKEKYLPAICRGEALTAIAVTEPGGGSDVAAIKTRAVRDGDHYIINGSKMFITNGVMADLHFVAARLGSAGEGRRHQGISMFLVERDTPGFSVSRKLDKMGNRASDTAELAFQDMRVPAENLLGQEGEGFYEVMRIFQRERLVAGIHTVAGCERALEDTIAYVQQRQAFAEPLSKKQVVRHKIADMATLLEAARCLTYAACLKFQNREESVKEISMVKLFCGDIAQKIAYDCVQLHGGYGYMREYSIERFFRDIRLLTIGGGTSEIMKEIIAKQLAL
ncbi:MAG: acyl-CoA dehydrogenase [Candidatus Rokubacteria bacterium GWF2_70_14]|nr:MAG: acyl-CoA dehydrogenase [Candidatus Rokubacteria bacterium GWA2_70_23]OGK93203.1 MAG: acyl-CoA dehydrogenase [Candidatus Rokubacteria bacterium GWF2_70_14]